MFRTQDDRLREISQSGNGKVFLGSQLRRALPGLDNRRINYIRLRRLDRNETIYSQYRGGIMWKPSARELGLKGEEFPLALEPLTQARFLKGLGELEVTNEVGARWAADLNHMRIELRNSELRVGCNQTPSIEGCSRFVLSGITAPGFQRYNEWVRLDFTAADSLGNQRSLALFHDGCKRPWMGIKCGRHFARVFMISSDGIRIRIVYGGSREFNVAVLYESDPSKIYSIEWAATSPALYSTIKGDLSLVGKVRLIRPLEQRMKTKGTAYDHGRLGSEIAYSAARDLLKPGRVILLEPSRGGKDLFSDDGKLVIQARMLVRTRDFAAPRLRDEVTRNLSSLILKVEQDFRHNDSATLGLAVLTFVDNHNDTELICYLRVRGAQRQPVTIPVQMALNS
jgi:hypothetical protein